MNIIEVDNLSFSYPQTPILQKLSFNVEAGSFLAIAGPNGSGKSTLINLLCRLLKPQGGTIKIDNLKINKYKRKSLAEKIAVVRQEFVPAFGFSVTETVMMARTVHFSQAGFETKTDREIVAQALEATDTMQFAKRSLAELSGGERQRVFIARALAQSTDILLLDEPTSFLDLKHQVGVYDLLKKVQLENGKTIVAVTHDINLASQYADTALLLCDQNSYDIGKIEDVFSQEQIEKVFKIKILSGNIGETKFFLPSGKFAKETYNKNEENSPPATS